MPLAEVVTNATRCESDASVDHTSCMASRHMPPIELQPRPFRIKGCSRLSAPIRSSLLCSVFSRLETRDEKWCHNWWTALRTTKDSSDGVDKFLTSDKKKKKRKRRDLNAIKRLLEANNTSQLTSDSDQADDEKPSKIIIGTSAPSSDCKQAQSETEKGGENHSQPTTAHLEYVSTPHYKAEPFGSNSTSREGNCFLLASNDPLAQSDAAGDCSSVDTVEDKVEISSKDGLDSASQDEVWCKTTNSCSQDSTLPPEAPESGANSPELDVPDGLPQHPSDGAEKSRHQAARRRKKKRSILVKHIHPQEKSRPSLFTIPELVTVLLVLMDCVLKITLLDPDMMTSMTTIIMLATGSSFGKTPQVKGHKRRIRRKTYLLRLVKLRGTRKPHKIPHKAKQNRKKNSTNIGSKIFKYLSVLSRICCHSQTNAMTFSSLLKMAASWINLLSWTRAQTRTRVEDETHKGATGDQATSVSVCTNRLCCVMERQMTSGGDPPGQRKNYA